MLPVLKLLLHSLSDRLLYNKISQNLILWTPSVLPSSSLARSLTIAVPVQTPPPEFSCLFTVCTSDSSWHVLLSLFFLLLFIFKSQKSFLMLPRLAREQMNLSSILCKRLSNSSCNNFMNYLMAFAYF